MSVSNSDSFMLSLSSTTQGNIQPDTDSLSYLLHLIGRQRGSFRNFTKESLQEEIDQQEGHPGVAGNTSEELKPSPQQNRSTEVQAADEPDRKSLANVREIMLRSISIALNESALALDFASLLMSSSQNAAAQSMSPALKAAVPSGSLSHTIVERDPSLTNNSNASASMFRSQALQRAAETLMNTSLQADKDARLEQVFWEEIQALIEAGWPVFRPKSETNGLAVKFGTGSNHYLPLVMTKEGHIDDSKLTTVTSSIIFSFERAKRVLAQHTGSGSESEVLIIKSGPISLIDKLTRARTTLHVRRKFNTLVKDARELAKNLVQVEEHRIKIPLLTDLDLVIQLREVAEESIPQSLDAEMTQNPSSDNLPYEQLLTAFRDMVNQESLTTAGSRSPIKQLLSWYNHGYQLSLIQTPVSKLMQGLSKYNWQLRLPIIESTDDSVSITEKTVSRFSIQFLSTVLSIVVSTETPPDTQFTVVATKTSAMTLAEFTTQSMTHSARKAMSFIEYTIFETIMEDLSIQNSTISRTSEEEVRLSNDLRVVLAMSREGIIHLKREDGKRKTIRAELLQEMCDENQWQ